ncbi:hypothetical protein BaRGS_00014695, partial [Batillaria attramentaria]
FVRGPPDTTLTAKVQWNKPAAQPGTGCPCVRIKRRQITPPRQGELTLDSHLFEPSRFPLGDPPAGAVRFSDVISLEKRPGLIARAGSGSMFVTEEHARGSV